jgi:cytochrome P450
MADMAFVPLQMWWFNNKFIGTAVERFSGETTNKFPNFVKWLLGRVDERMKVGIRGRRKDMLQHFTEMEGMSDSKATTEAEVSSECLIMLGAGDDTTATAITSVLGRLITNLNIVLPLQREVDQAYQSLRIDSHTGITYNDAAKLPFLSAIIKECMRFCPPISYQLSRFTYDNAFGVENMLSPEAYMRGLA